MANCIQQQRKSPILVHSPGKYRAYGTTDLSPMRGGDGLSCILFDAEKYKINNTILKSPMNVSTNMATEYTTVTNDSSDMTCLPQELKSKGKFDLDDGSWKQEDSQQENFVIQAFRKNYKEIPDENFDVASTSGSEVGVERVLSAKGACNESEEVGSVSSLEYTDGQSMDILFAKEFCDNHIDQQKDAVPLPALHPSISNFSGEANSKIELLERQIRVLQACGERAEAERAELEQSYCQLQERLQDLQQQLELAQKKAILAEESGDEKIRSAYEMMNRAIELDSKLSKALSKMEELRSAATSQKQEQFRSHMATESLSMQITSLEKERDLLKMEKLSKERALEEKKMEMNSLESQMSEMYQAALDVDVAEAKLAAIKDKIDLYENVSGKGNAGLGVIKFVVQTADEIIKSQSRQIEKLNDQLKVSIDQKETSSSKTIGVHLPVDRTIQNTNVAGRNTSTNISRNSNVSLNQNIDIESGKELDVVNTRTEFMICFLRNALNKRQYSSSFEALSRFWSRSTEWMLSKFPKISNKPYAMLVFLILYVLALHLILFIF